MSVEPQSIAPSSVRAAQESPSSSSNMQITLQVGGQHIDPADLAMHSASTQPARSASAEHVTGWRLSPSVFSEATLGAELAASTSATDTVLQQQSAYYLPIPDLDLQLMQRPAVDPLDAPQTLAYAVENPDDVNVSTSRMPGAFDPLPSQSEEVAASRALAGLGSLQNDVVPTPREVNPRIDLDALAQRLPDDVIGCVAYVLSSMKKSLTDIPALETLVTRQAQVLSDKGIHTREQFVSLLKQVQWRDTGAGILHGMASANGFNVASAAVNFKLADITLQGLAKSLPQLPSLLPALIGGAMLGFGLSVADAASGASANKTFHNAYFTRPPEDQLPTLVANLNPPTKTSMSLDLTLAAGMSFGVARNVGIRMPLMFGFEGSGQPDKRALADNIADPLGGSIVGGGGMRLIRNDRDVGAGRAGFQHFLARDDLGACIDHLQKPALAQIESALRRTIDYMKNAGLTLPSAVGDAFASKLGWTSHAILTPGFGGLFAMLTTMPAALTAKGWTVKDANIATQVSKFVVLQVLYHAWGGALGAVAGGTKAAEQATDGAHAV